MTHIAKLSGIDIDYLDKEASEETKKKIEGRQKLLDMLDIVQKWFVSSLAGEDADAVLARAYAIGRWGEEYVGESGIGYAPKDSGLFMEFVRKYDLDMGILKELEILQEAKEGSRLYPFFFDRITIPIRDPKGQVIGFTARYMGERKEVPKYMNSKENPVYSKGKSLFGIDKARRAARDEDYVIVVEGAPDVMRMQMIGLSNTVAPLGSALTSDHLKQIQKISKAVCFIPDSDPPKQEGKLPPGFNSVYILAVIHISEPTRPY